MDLVDKCEWLFSQPFRAFHGLNALLIAEVWVLIEGHPDLIMALSPGRKARLEELYDSMHRMN